MAVIISASGTSISTYPSSFNHHRTPLRKHIRSIPLIPDPFKPLLRLFNTLLLPHLLRPLQHHAQCHILNRIADLVTPTNKALAALLKQFHHFLALRPQPILNVLAPVRLVRLAAVRAPDLHRAHCFPARELVSVEVVAIRGVAAEEEERRGEGAPSAELRGAFLDEAAERSEAWV